MSGRFHIEVKVPWRKQQAPCVRVLDETEGASTGWFEAPMALRDQSPRLIAAAVAIAQSDVRDMLEKAKQRDAAVWINDQLIDVGAFLSTSVAAAQTVLLERNTAPARAAVKAGRPRL